MLHLTAIAAAAEERKGMDQQLRVTPKYNSKHWSWAACKQQARGSANKPSSLPAHTHI